MLSKQSLININIWNKKWFCLTQLIKVYKIGKNIKLHFHCQPQCLSD